MSSIASGPLPAPSRRALLRSLAGTLRVQPLSPGALASLRRGTSADVARQAAFHRLIADVPESWLADDALLRWATVVQCLAITGAPASHGESDGRMLATAGLTESRFARLLASHGDGLSDQLLLVARFLHAKDVRPTWVDLGELVLTDTVLPARADVIRLVLARDYYRSPSTLAPT
ncbi:MAG: type I-E CRISPR-associated protein Cse2/CasB [Gemmatimonadaceae bacterium]|jgi:hypothetical protein|nr:type I-E CRISPR-associated protein Cse2/CasB [Gemmatimonadaceae bacterium]